jgi:hypothetical protein
MVLACYAGFTALGWFLNGFGALLPDIEEHIGQRATDVYPLLPGAALLVWGVIILRRPTTPTKAHPIGVIAGPICLAAGAVVMGITKWLAVSAIGAVLAAVAAAYMVRLLPGVLFTLRSGDTERAMMRSNAYSSVAAISAPLAIGASIQLGWGWLPGMALPLGIFAIWALLTGRPGVSPEAPPTAEPADPTPVDTEVVPPIAFWWRDCAVLAMCIVVEFCFSYFATTYLHDELGLSKAKAAAGGAAWGIGMTIGRFIVSTFPPPRTVVPSVIGIGIGFALFWGVPNGAVAIAGIGIAGLGASPLYASRLTALIARFPGSPHQGSARGSLASGMALLAAPAVMVSLRAVSDVRTAYLAVPVMLVVLVVLARPWQAGTPVATPQLT